MAFLRLAIALVLLLPAFLVGRGPQATSCAREQSYDHDARRQTMVREQILARGIEDPDVLRAMRAVPRHRFVPPGLEGRAYEDNPLPIGEGQTISQPYIVALMTELLQPERGQKMLEVGTGSGYQAAVLAEIVDTVFTIEIVEPLAVEARDRLHRLDYGNVLVRHGDGYAGWPEHAPFDGIIVTAAAAEIPQPLIDQLKEGGRMIIPTGEPWAIQSLTLAEKRNGRLVTQEVAPVRFVPLTREKR
jgi:protein-L-isoaspartate(D-aspartate) O-methyltransferase